MSDNNQASSLPTVFINGNKISTIIPNRIFVGGFPQDTSEDELKSFFGRYGEIKDVKIVPDKLGQAKGSYGFVTFESQEVAERIITEQAECLVFRDKKLNIGRAVKKQPLVGKSDIQNNLVVNPFMGGYNSIYPYQDYSCLFNGQDLTTASLYQNYAHLLPQLPFLQPYSLMNSLNSTTPVAQANAAQTLTSSTQNDPLLQLFNPAVSTAQQYSNYFTLPTSTPNLNPNLSFPQFFSNQNPDEYNDTKETSNKQEKDCNSENKSPKSSGFVTIKSDFQSYQNKASPSNGTKKPSSPLRPSNLNDYNSVKRKLPSNSNHNYDIYQPEKRLKTENYTS